MALPAFDSLIAALRHFGGPDVVVVAQEPAPGGCINNGFTVTLKDGRRCFAKLNRRDLLGMFRQEAAGLAALATASYATGAGLRIPEAIALGTEGGHAFLLLEYLEPAQPTEDCWKSLGRGLALLHRGGGSGLFGFDEDNYIGSTPQRNSWSPSWPGFFAAMRLAPQLGLARSREAASPELARAVESIIERIDQLLPPLSRPGLVHGDLWNGNVLATAIGAGAAGAAGAAPGAQAVPALIDPAVYWGDPLVDLAMTELFGGFPRGFYDAYREVADPGPEYKRLRGLYNLYHLLNHLNIMGREYHAECLRVAQSYA
jgi:fructosamine-3-kinase